MQLLAPLIAAAREGYRAGRRRRWCLERFDRRADMDSWFSVGPVRDGSRTGRVVGVSGGGPRRCVAVFLLDIPDHPTR